MFSSYYFSVITPVLHKKLLTSILISRNSFNFSSSTTLCVMNVYCDPVSNNNFIAQTCVSFAICSRFVLILTRREISSSDGFSLTFFGLRNAVA